MSVELSNWLLEGIDLAALESDTVEPLATTDIADYYNAPGYSNAYNDYYNYSVYYNYSDYSVYYNYYNYSNYSNSISVTRQPISQSVLVNEMVTLSVGASNTIDSCQWYIADSATGSGTPITGATSPTYSFNAVSNLDGKYYYCIVRRGGNSATSSRALLTVMSINAFDICVPVNIATRMFFVRANPPTTTITSVVVDDESVATATNNGVVTGVSLGTTTCRVTGSNGATATFNIKVLPEDQEIVVDLTNIATAIREYQGVSYSIYPNQMANVLRNRERISTTYYTLQEMFTDIADAIREVDGTTATIDLSDMYYRILSLTTL